MVVSVNVLRGGSRAGVSSSSSATSCSFLCGANNARATTSFRNSHAFSRSAPRQGGQRGAEVVVKGAKKTFHTVQKGEWLSSIAPQYDVTTAELRDANAKSIEEGDLIYPGQQLLVPVAAQSGGMSVKGVLVKVVVALLILAAASGIWPTIKESQEQQNK